MYVKLKYINIYTYIYIIAIFFKEIFSFSLSLSLSLYIYIYIASECKNTEVGGPFGWYGYAFWSIYKLYGEKNPLLAQITVSMSPFSEINSIWNISSMRPLRSCMKCCVKRIPYFKNGENIAAKKKKIWNLQYHLQQLFLKYIQ